MTRPFVLAIAGFDPSGGAGIMADTKTLEINKVQGLGVVSAITFQNESQLTGLEWISLDAIISQLEILFQKYDIGVVKIGLIESLQIMKQIVDFLLRKNPKIKIIWDPVIKASSGYMFHNSFAPSDFAVICKKMFMITPNWKEMEFLYPQTEPLEAAKVLSNSCMVYLKGGHYESHKGKDYLFEASRQCSFNPKIVSEFEKHGSGCVFASALSAFIARGFPLRKACLKAKNYVAHFLLSNKTLLGYHR